MWVIWAPFSTLVIADFLGVLGFKSGGVSAERALKKQKTTSAQQGSRPQVGERERDRGKGTELEQNSGMKAAKN